MRRKAKTSQSSQVMTGWQLVFAIDVTALYNGLNNKLQDERLFVHEMHMICSPFTCSDNAPSTFNGKQLSLATLLMLGLRDGARSKMPPRFLTSLLETEVLWFQEFDHYKLGCLVQSVEANQICFLHITQWGCFSAKWIDSNRLWSFKCLFEGHQNNTSLLVPNEE